MDRFKIDLTLVGCVIAIGVFTLAGTFLLITGYSYFFAFVCLVVVLLITLFITRLINGLNRRITDFFKRLEHEDFTFSCPPAGDGVSKELSAEMNRIIALFSRNRNELEEKRLYYESILRVLTHEMRNSLAPIASLSSDLLRQIALFSPEPNHANGNSPTTPAENTPSSSFLPLLTEIQQSLEVIRSQAADLGSFLDSYHRLTHLPDPHRQPVRIPQLFEKLNRLLSGEPGSQCIRYEAPASCVVMADPNLILLALINLLRNALQALDGQPDGRITVEAAADPDTARPFIQVSDNGPGIPPELLSSIFTPFFSTKTGGSGIGLSICRRIMRLHEGELTVESQQGVKTTFIMRF